MMAQKAMITNTRRETEKMTCSVIVKFFKDYFVFLPAFSLPALEKGRFKKVTKFRIFHMIHSTLHDMTVQQIMTELKSHGSDSIKKLLVKHGVREPFFGVKIEYLKPIQKKIKKDYQLAKDLYATGNADAMYLAGLIADDEKMTAADLQTWVRQALSQNISEYTVPWVATGGRYGHELAMEWIDAKEENTAAAGWATLSG